MQSTRPGAIFTSWAQHHPLHLWLGKTTQWPCPSPLIGCKGCPSCSPAPWHLLMARGEAVWDSPYTQSAARGGGISHLAVPAAPFPPAPPQPEPELSWSPHKNVVSAKIVELQFQWVPIYNTAFTNLTYYYTCILANHLKIKHLHSRSFVAVSQMYFKNNICIDYIENYSTLWLSQFWVWSTWDFQGTFIIIIK